MSEVTESSRVLNFSAGPSALPLEVLKTCQKDMLNWQGTGMSVMEMSHRSKEFAGIFAQAKNDMGKLLKVPENYEILFMQGGATTQFSCVPLNLASLSDEAPDYIVTGGWSKKAAEEANKLLGKPVHVVTDNTADLSVDVSDSSTWKLNPKAPYTYYCVNETVFGLQYMDIPETKNPLVADFSSCFMSEPIDVTKFGVIIAGAQKNIGPAGVTVVIIRKDLIGHAFPNCPILLNYQILAKKDSMYNTPPCYAIYVCGLVFKWIQKTGGLEVLKEINYEKARLLYDAIESSDFYRAPVNKKYRSIMNVRVEIWPEPNRRDGELEKKFVAEAAQNGMMNLKGHRSLGGIRMSIYNAQSIANCKKLVSFMNQFAAQNRVTTKI